MAKPPAVLTAEQQEMVTANIGLVKVVALERWRCLPPSVRAIVDRDEMIQAGMVGLISAVQRYDASRGAFSKFANWRIKGECIEFLRKQGRWMSGANAGQRTAPKVHNASDEFLHAAPAEPADSDADGEPSALALIPPRMSASQRAAIAVSLLPELRKAARHRMLSALRRRHCPDAPKKVSEPGEARQQAALAVGVNPLYVSHAARISKDAPDLFARLLTGELSISAALHTLRARRKIG